MRSDRTESTFDMLIRRLLRFRRRDQQIGKELRFHIDSLAEDYMRQGLSEDDARRKAVLEFGPVAQVEEECRDTRPTIRMESLIRDAAFAIRGFRRHPRFAVSAAESNTICNPCSFAF